MTCCSPFWQSPPRTISGMKLCIVFVNDGHTDEKEQSSKSGWMLYKRHSIFREILARLNKVSLQWTPAIIVTQKRDCRGSGCVLGERVYTVFSKDSKVATALCSIINLSYVKRSSTFVSSTVITSHRGILRAASSSRVLFSLVTISKVGSPYVCLRMLKSSRVLCVSSLSNVSTTISWSWAYFVLKATRKPNSWTFLGNSVLWSLGFGPNAIPPVNCQMLNSMAPSSF